MKKYLLLSFLMVFSFAFSDVWAQEMSVSGKVTSQETGETLPGVNVVLKGTTRGTVTDFEGNYQLSVPSDGGTLVFSFIGLKTQEVEIAGRTVIDVQMASDVTQLTEVVIQGYSNLSEKRMVSSLSVVGDREIEDVPLPDVNQIIQGRAAGVYTTAPSGQPGAAIDIRVRGTGSISAGRGPLYVIDGIIVENGDFTTQTTTNDALSNINPNDIANITVLKDASATALYGSRGANGVVLITTKRGKKGGTKINASVQYGVTIPNTGNFEMMDAETVWEYERQMLENSGYSQAVIDGARPASMLDYTTDWVDAAFKQGNVENYELTASGGDEKTRFYISSSVFQQDGTLIESSFDRYSIRSNIDHDLNEKLDFGLNLNVSYTNQLNAVAGNRFASPLLGAFVNTPLQSAYDPETGELYTGLESDWAIFTNDNFLYSAPINPVTNRNLRTLGKLNLGYDILDNLNFSQNLAIDFLSIREKAFYDPTTNDGVDDNGAISEAYNQNITYTSQSKLSGFWTFSDVHNLDALAVMEYQEADRTNFNAYGTGLASGKLQTLNSTATPQGVGGFDSRYSFLSYLGQINYNFDNKYYLTLSGRRDGSSRFGENNRYANFWAAGVSWRLIEESFIDFDFLSNLVLRASYGTSGNAEIGNFASRGLYGYSVAYLGQPASVPSQVSNPDLTWEVSTNTNIGLEVGLFDGRVNITADVYQREADELLFDVPVPATSGFTEATRNLGTLQNRGLELVLNTVNVQANDFTWSTDFNISFNRNEVISLPDGEDVNNGSQLIREGEPLRTWYMQKWAGVNPADGTPLWYTEDGDVTGNYAQAGRFIVGNAEPDFIGGLNNRLSYKGLNLSFFFYFVSGNEVYNSSRRFIESDGQRYGWNHLVDAGQDYWTQPGDIATRPQPLVGGNNASNSRSTRYLEDGSFIRLRNIMLSYNIPTNLTDRVGLSGVRIYAQGQNLLTITDYSGFDPEMDESGDEFFRYPVGKTISFGLEVSL